MNCAYCGKSLINRINNITQKIIGHYFVDDKSFCIECWSDKKAEIKDFLLEKKQDV